MSYYDDFVEPNAFFKSSYLIPKIGISKKGPKTHHEDGCGYMYCM